MDLKIQLKIPRNNKQITLERFQLKKFNLEIAHWLINWEKGVQVTIKYDNNFPE